MIDARRYNRLTPKGLTDILKKDEDYYLTFKRFSVEDGGELPPEEQLIQIQEIKERIAIIEDELKGLNEVLSKIPQ